MSDQDQDHAQEGEPSAGQNVYTTITEYLIPLNANDPDVPGEIYTHESDNTGPHTHSDIFHAAWCLQQVLPAELVPGILQYAEFVESQGSTWTYLRNLSVGASQSPSQIFSTEALKTRVRRAAPVTSVEFRISASGCGRGAAREGEPPLTWFTAGIVREDRPDKWTIVYTLHSKGDCENGALHVNHPEGTINKVGGDRASLPSKNTTPFVPIVLECPLAESSTGLLDATIVWYADSLVKHERDFVTSLRPGDRVIIRAWARHAERWNNVKLMSVTMRTPVVVR